MKQPHHFVCIAPALACASLAFTARAQNPLYERVGAQPGEYLGSVLIQHADVDGDGIPESLVSGQRGLFLLRGSDGSLLRSFQRAVLALGDLDGDGWSELAAPGPQDWWYLPAAKQIEVLSGASGQVVATWNWNSGTGSVARGWPQPLGDVNGDGVGDVLTNETTTPTSGWQQLYAVLVVSGVDGSELRRHDGPSLGFAMGDTNGDGVVDYFLEETGASAIPPLIAPARLISGASGAALATYPSMMLNLGQTARLPDMDFDGVPEIAREVYPGPDVRIVSGATGIELRALAAQVALAAYLIEPFEALAADVDGDGVREIGLFDPLTQTTTLQSLASGAVLARYHVLGTRVLNAGDVDGDGKEDLFFGSPYAHGTRGRVLLATSPLDDRVGVGFAYGSSACPCGPGAPEAGCAGNLPSGTALTAWGSSSLSSRNLQFLAAGFGLDAGLNSMAFLMHSSSTLATFQPSGAGFLALAAPRTRIAKFTCCSMGIADARTLAVWNSFSAGQTEYFQVWSREYPVGLGNCPRPHNFSNALAITFTP